ncbi:MAG TPA: glycosyltransferase family 39 protein [Candidatus Saccharimonadales bacterium]|nr:glycosyltransferase family 39 protein [Candidatus Saccharimonadales bacterium]
MNIRPVNEWTLYRMRFLLAYVLLAIITAALLAFYLDIAPPGLGPTEKQSIVSSAAISFKEPPTNIVDLPFHVLQKLSVEWLGVTPLGVRLPSLVFGGLTALCMALLLRRWFKTNIALAVSLIFVTSTWFLSVARLGAPFIMIPLWTSILLLTATYVSQQTKAWKWWRVAFAMAAALSMYTPFMAYFFIAAALATIAQPHLRYLLRESNRVNLFIGGFFFILLLVPLGWGIYKEPGVIRDLLAIPAALPDPLQFAKGLWHAISNVINPYNLAATEMITPTLGIVTCALLLTGGARLLRDFHSVRAHVLLLWAALLVPIVAFNPTQLTALLVPTMLVVAIGLNQIIRYWYRLFPRNPYARLFGLVPLTILVISIVQLNYQRYTFGMIYSKQAGQTFNQDAFLAQKELMNIDKARPVTFVVAPENEALYNVLAGRRPSTAVETGETASDRAGTWIVQNSQYNTVAQKVGAPSKLLVTDQKADALRLTVHER